MRETRRLTLAFLAAMLAVSTAAHAEDDPFRVAGASIAKLNTSGWRSLLNCTAVQAGARSALVLKGCLDEGRFDRAHLLFGYDRQRWAEHRTALTAYPDPTIPEVRLLCLDADLPPATLALAPERPEPGDRLFVAAYVPPKVHRLTVRGCTVAPQAVEGGFALDCALGEGVAGAAVFSRSQAAGARLLGIIAGKVGERYAAARWSGRSPDKLCPPLTKQEASKENG